MTLVGKLSKVNSVKVSPVDIPIDKRELLSASFEKATRTNQNSAKKKHLNKLVNNVVLKNVIIIIKNLPYIVSN